MSNPLPSQLPWLNTPSGNFSPQNIQTPDTSAQTAAGPGGISSAAQPPSLLNRVASSLGISSLTQPNSASVQNGNPATANTKNITAAQGTELKSFVENPLDSFDNITYNFKLYLAPEPQLLDQTKLPSGPLYIVAQSGITANFYIKDVEIESSVGPNGQTRNIRSTSLKMTIVEPQGVSLIDKLISACSQLGIKNISICPMCIELSFRGYSIAGTIAPTSNLTRTWRASLTNINTTLNEGGAEYEVTFMLLQDYAFNRMNDAAIIQQQVNIPVTKVGKFFTDLGVILSNQSRDNAKQAGQISQNQYVFTVSPQMADWVIGESPQVPNTPSQFIESDGPFLPGNGPAKSIVLSTDMTIDRIVDVILSSTKEGNQMVNPNSTLEKMNNDPTAPKVSQIASITSKVEFSSFNATANDYNRKYTYYINKYDSYRVNIDKPTNQAQDARAQKLLQGALQKKYEYMFTGENTDVLRLDLNLNNLWRAANYYYASNLQRKNNVNAKFLNPQNKAPTATGADDLRAKSTQTQFAAKPITPATGQTNASVSTAPLPSQLPWLNTPSSLTTTSSPLKSSTLSSPQTLNISSLDQLSSSNLISPSLLSNAVTTLKTNAAAGAPVQAPTANTPAGIPVLSGLVTKLLPTSISNQLSSLLGKPTSTSSTKTVNNSKSPNAQSSLIETLNSTPSSTNTDPAVLSMYTKQIDSQLDTSRIDSNIEEGTNLGRSIFGIVTNQLYDVKYADLIKIGLEIRGDPFWLGETDLEIFTRLASMTAPPAPPSTSTSKTAKPATPVGPPSAGQTNISLPSQLPWQNTPKVNRPPVPQASTASTGQATANITSPSKSGFANFLAGENCLFLTFQTPKNYNESTGFVDLQQADLFIGVYSVYNIVHTFSEGKFTQTLNCIRDIQTDPKVLAKYVNIKTKSPASSTTKKGSSKASGKTGSTSPSILSSILGGSQSGSNPQAPTGTTPTLASLITKIV